MLVLVVLVVVIEFAVAVIVLVGIFTTSYQVNNKNSSQNKSTFIAISVELDWELPGPKIMSLLSLSNFVCVISKAIN